MKDLGGFTDVSDEVSDGLGDILSVCSLVKDVKAEENTPCNTDSSGSVKVLLRCCLVGEGGYERVCLSFFLLRNGERLKSERLDLLVLESDSKRVSYIVLVSSLNNIGEVGVETTVGIGGWASPVSFPIFFQKIIHGL